jgi:type I restriction enzyme, S subunit
MMQSTITTPTSRKKQLGDLSSRWHIGRLHPVPERKPEGWELVDLTSVATLESGHTPSRNNPRYWNGMIPWVSLHDSSALDVPSIDETSQSVTELGIANSSARLLPEGTVIFSRTATVGKATVLGREMATSQDFANYVCGDRLHNRYLMYLFRFMQPEWKRLMAGSTHNTIYMPVFRVIQILLPPIPEQRAIAAALSDVDELIGALDKLIAKKRAIKLAAMQQLLTGKTRLPGFGGEWATTRIGDVLTVRHGRSQHDVAVADGRYPILASGGEIGRTDTPLYEKPSVLIGRKGTIDDPQFVSSPFWTVDTLFYTEMEAGTCAKFMFYKFCMIPWRSYNEASGVPSLNSRTIEGIEITVPQEAEQTAITEVLSDMDAEIGALEQRRDKTKAIKQGIMQVLLTGRVRLIEPERSS